MLGIVKDILSLATSALHQILRARKQAAKSRAGEILYRIQRTIGDILDVADRLHQALQTGAPLPPACEFYEPGGTDMDISVALLEQQAQNVQGLERSLKLLLEVGGDALDPQVIRQVTKALEVKSGVIDQLVQALFMRSYPTGSESGKLLTLCADTDVFIEEAKRRTARHIEWIVIDQQRLIKHIFSDYEAQRSHLEETQNKLSRLYRETFSHDERLSIGRAVRRKEKRNGDRQIF